MTHITVTTNLDIDPWTDLRGQITEDAAVIERIGFLPNGTQEGRACVELVCRRRDGSLFIAETTWRLFQGAVLALTASPAAQMENL